MSTEHRPLHHRDVLESFARVARLVSSTVIGVYVCGSALREDFSAASDLDVTVLCDRRVPLSIRYQLLRAARAYSSVSRTLDVRVLSSRALTLLERHQLSRHSRPIWGPPVRPPRRAANSDELLARMRDLARSGLERSTRAAGLQRRRLWGKGTLRLLYLDELRRDCTGLGARQMLDELLASRPSRSVTQRAHAALTAVEGTA
jgi:predicted nucleotidyltransferase